MDKERLISLCDENNAYYEDINIGAFVSLVIIGKNGIYVATDIKDEKKLKSEFDSICKKLKVSDRQLFYFAFSEEESGVFYDNIKGFIPFDDIHEAFENCYLNHTLPQNEISRIDPEFASDYCYEMDFNDTEGYTIPVITDRALEKIVEIVEGCTSEPEVKGRYRIYPDGSMETKRTVNTRKVGPVMAENFHEMWFPCFDEEGDKTLIYTALGGFFGLHKYRQGKILQGILYTLTFGVCGVFYFFDVFNVLIGNYKDGLIIKDNTSRFKAQIYSRPVKNKIKGAILCAIALVIAFCGTKFLYFPLVSTLGDKLTQKIASEENVGKFINSNAGEKVLDTIGFDLTDEEIEKMIGD